VETLLTNVGVADVPAFVLVLDDLNASPYDAHRVIRAGLGVLDALPGDALTAVVNTSGIGGSLLTLTPPGPEHAARVRAFRGQVLLTGPKDRSRIRTTPSSVDAPCGVGSGVLHSPDCGDPTRAARRAQVIDAVARILGQAGSRRKVIFWITEDMGVSPLDPKGNQTAQRNALRRVLNADVAVYPVNPREGHADLRSSAVVDEGDRGDNRPDRRTGGRIRIGPGDSLWIGGPGTTLELNTDDMVAVTLDQIARESGGRWITGTNDLHRVLADVVVQNTTSYLLAFDAAGTRTPGRHRIDVRVRRDGARVFARRAYVVPEAPEASAVARKDDVTSLLRETLQGAAPQGRLAMKLAVVPGFAVGRDGRALVTIHVEDDVADGVPVHVAIVSIDGDGKTGEEQVFRMPVPEHGTVRELTTPLALARGTHQIRVAAVTSDGARTGLVMAPVEVLEPGNDLLLSPPVLLGGTDGKGFAPTLARTFDVGSSVGVQVEVAGRPARDGSLTVVGAFHDARGGIVRAADAVIDRGVRSDRLRAAATLPTAGMPPGDYLLVVEARAESGAPSVRHAVPLTLRSPAIAPPPPVAAAGEPITREVMRPLILAHGPGTTHAPVGAMVIRHEAAWKAFWLHLPTRQPVPDIDFARATLVAFVIDGGTGALVQPAVDRIEREREGVVVRWRIVRAQPADAANRRPFLVVGLLGHQGPVRFERVE
jgi:VWFA-related protein